MLYHGQFPMESIGLDATVDATSEDEALEEGLTLSASRFDSIFPSFNAKHWELDTPDHLMQTADSFDQWPAVSWSSALQQIQASTTEDCQFPAPSVTTDGGSVETYIESDLTSFDDADESFDCFLSLILPVEPPFPSIDEPSPYASLDCPAPFSCQEDEAGCLTDLEIYPSQTVSTPRESSDNNASASSPRVPSALPSPPRDENYLCTTCGRVCKTGQALAYASSSS